MQNPLQACLLCSTSAAKSVDVCLLYVDHQCLDAIFGNAFRAVHSTLGGTVIVSKIGAR